MEDIDGDFRFLLFGGKGGGKTTSAAATALHLAKTNPDKRILIFSTDPAHSLSDSFDVEIGDRITPITENLYGLEMDAKKVQQDFKAEHEVDMFDLATRAIYFDTDILLDFFSFSLPRMEDLMAIMKIIEFMNAREFHQVIFDTPPTGHTLRFLASLDKMLDQIKVMESSQEKYQYAKGRFSGRYVKDAADLFLEGLKQDVTKVKSILIDSSLTRFVAVTTPEAMAIHETGQFLAALKGNRFPVRHLVVNGIAPSMECGLCGARRDRQERYMEEINKRFSTYLIKEMPLFSHEVRGIDGLEGFAEVLFGKEYIPSYPEAPLLEEAPVAPRPKFHGILGKGLKFLLFGGKGGVGKTTCAAATALHLARTNPDKRTLIFSTTLVHSLSDSLGLEIGNRATPITDNLWALEIDAARMFEDFKEGYIEEIDRVFDALEGSGGSVDLSFERRITLDLFSMTPPGVDELMALAKIMEFTENGEYDLFVLDAVPTGHLLRMLELPEVVVEWFDKLIQMLRKYEDREGVPEVMEFLLDTKWKIKDTQRTLKDPDQTEFVAVSIPEAMVVLETRKLLMELRGLEMSAGHLIINRVIPPNRCAFCSSKRREQQVHIQEIGSLLPGLAATEMPLLPGEVRGIGLLEDFAGIMYEDHLEVLTK